MMQTITIPLTSGYGRHVQARFDDVAGSELAVILPGLRYGCERPLLSGVTGIFQDRGCDIARLIFNYSEDTGFLDADDDTQLAQIATDGCDIIGNLVGSKHYQRVWIIGKSLGTVSMGAALSERTFPTDCVRAVWLTPSLIGTPLSGQLLAQNHTSIVVIGTQDPSFRPELIDPLEAAPNVVVRPIQSANRGFEHSGGADASNEVVSEAVQAVATWVHRQAE